MIVRDSLFDTQERVNCESLVAFNGVDQYADAGVNENIIGAVDFDRDFVIGFTFQLNEEIAVNTPVFDRYTIVSYTTSSSDSNTVQAGFQIHIQRQTGNLHRIVFLATHQTSSVSQIYYIYPSNVPLNIHQLYSVWFQHYADKTGDFYLNGQKLPVTLFNQGNYQNISYYQAGGQRLLLGATMLQTTPKKYAAVELANLVILSGIHSQSSVSSMHRYGNWLATDALRQACVAHYVPDREGLTMWDVVEQYNAAKPFQNDASTLGSAIVGDFSFTWEPSIGNDDNGILLGVNTTQQPTSTFSDVEYGWISTSVNDYMRTAQSGALGVSSQAVVYQDGDKFIIRRVGSIVEWLYDQTANGGSIESRKTVTNVTGTLYPVVHIIFSSSKLDLSRVVFSQEPNFPNNSASVVGGKVIAKQVLSPYPATLQNFTPQQVEGSGQSAYLDFYSKRIENRAILVVPNDNQTTSLSWNGILGPEWKRLSDFTIYLKVEASINTNDFQFPLRFHNSTNQANYGLFMQNRRVSFNMTTASGSPSNTMLLPAHSENKVLQSLGSFPHYVFISYQQGVGATFTVFSDSKTYSQDTNSNYTGPIEDLGFDRLSLVNPSDSPNVPRHQKYEYHDLALYSTALTHAQKELIVEQGILQVEPIDYFLFDNFTGGDTVYTKLGYSIAANKTKGYPDNYLSPSYFLEKSSLLPPLRNALKFDAASNQYASVANFNPTKEKGYTILAAFSFNGEVFNAYNGILAKRSGSSYFLLTAHTTSKQLDFYFQTGKNVRTPAGAITDLQAINMFVATVEESNGGVEVEQYINGRPVKSVFIQNTTIKGFDEIPVDLNIGLDNGHYFDGPMPQTGIAKGIITPSQVIELWNNSLLANPKASWKNLEWQLYPSWNQIIDDGSGNYSVSDSSPENVAIPLTGFTAPNLDPNDPLYALTQINDLR